MDQPIKHSTGIERPKPLHRNCEVFIKLNDSAKRAHEETPPQAMTKMVRETETEYESKSQTKDNCGNRVQV